jgi:multiple sugar transport system permease protein
MTDETTRTDGGVANGSEDILEQTPSSAQDPANDLVERLTTVGLVGLMGFIAVVMIGPFLYMLSVSLMEPGTVRAIPPKFLPAAPIKWGLHNYQRVIVDFNFGRVLFNTLLVTGGVTVFNVFFDTLAGYVFAKLRFPGRKLLFMLILATLMVPNQVTVVPLYIIVNDLGLLNTHLGMALPFAASAFGIFLMKQFMETIPTELEKAAMVDGCTRFEVFYKMVIPLSKPAMATLAIFTFIGTWNAFLWPLLVAQDKSMYILSVALAQFQGRFEADIAALMTGSALAAIPVILLFIALQKYYVRGIKLSGVKG